MRGRRGMRLGATSASAGPGDENRFQPTPVPCPSLCTAPGSGYGTRTGSRVQCPHGLASAEADGRQEGVRPVVSDRLAGPRTAATGHETDVVALAGRDVRETPVLGVDVGGAPTRALGVT